MMDSTIIILVMLMAITRVCLDVAIIECNFNLYSITVKRAFRIITFTVFGIILGVIWLFGCADSELKSWEDVKKIQPFYYTMETLE